MHSALPQAMVICYANHAERINPFPTRLNDKYEFAARRGQRAANNWVYFVWVKVTGVNTSPLGAVTSTVTV